VNAALVVAGGRGVRFGRSGGKQLIPIAGRPMLAWTLDAFETARHVDAVVVVFRPALLIEAERSVKQWGATKVAAVVAAGPERQDSVAAGLAALPEDATIVAVHDGARPLVLPGDIDAAIEALDGWDGVVLGRPAVDTVKRVADDGTVEETLARRDLWQAETPQVFEVATLKAAHERAERERWVGTDDAALVERAGGRVRMLAASGPNFKITVPQDVILAAAALGARKEGA